MHLLQMSGQIDLSLEEFEQEDYNFEGLEAIASDDNKIEFLKVLSSSTSQQFIEWLKMETNGKYVPYGYAVLWDLKFCGFLILTMHSGLHTTEM